MKNKLLLIYSSIIILLCISISSAALFEKKTYYEESRQITIDKAFLGIKLPEILGGGEIANVKLETEIETKYNSDLDLNYYEAPIGESSKIAQLNISADSIKDIIAGTKIYRINPYYDEYSEEEGIQQRELIDKPVQYKYLTTQLKERDTQDYVCSESKNGNGSVCGYIKNGTEEYIEETWNDLDLNTYTERNIILGLFTEVKDDGYYYDWVITLGGIELDEWAVYVGDPALKGYFKLDEGSGTGTNNSVIPNIANQGNLTNTPTWIPGKLGTGLRFVGASSQYVVLGNNSAYNYLWNFTINYWFNATNTSTGYMIARDSGLADNNLKYRVAVGSTGCVANQICFEASLDGNYLTFAQSQVPNIGDGLWHMLTAKTNGTHLSLYIDGTLRNISLNPSGTPALTSTSTRFGARNNGNYYTGDLDEIGIWNRTLTDGDIQELYNNGNALSFPFITANITINVLSPSNASVTNNKSIQIAINSTAINSTNPLNPADPQLVNTSIYILNKSQIDLDNDPNLRYHSLFLGNALDSSRYGNNGTLINNTLPVESVYGSGFRFNGYDNYIRTIIPTLSNTSFTLSAWANSGSFINNNEHEIIHLINDTTNFFYTALSYRNNTGNPRIYARLQLNNSGCDFTKANNYELGQEFVLITGTYDSILGNQSLYINGEIVSSGLISETCRLNYLSNYNNFSRVGIANTYVGGANQFFNGSINDVRIYNRSLSAQEIATLYNQTQPTFKESYTATNTRLTNVSVDVSERGLHNIFTWTTNSTGYGAGNNSIYFNVEPNYSIELHTPINNTNYSTSNIRFSANATGGVINTYNFTLKINGDNNYSVTGDLGASTGFNLTMNLPDGNYNWTSIITDFNGTNTTTNTRFFSVDTTNPQVLIISPHNQSYIYPYNQTYVNISLNITPSDSTSSISSCWFNSTFDSNIEIIPCGINKQINLTNIFGYHTIWAYANDSVGNIEVNETTFIIPKVSYNSTAQILTNEGFSINQSYFNSLTSTGIILNYNSINYATSITIDSASNTIGSRTLEIPSTSGLIPFYFSTTLSNGTVLNSPNYYQNVQSFIIDGCTTGTTLLMNLSNFDQDNLNRLSNNTFNVQVRVGNSDLSQYVQFANNFTNKISAPICLDINLTNQYRLDAIIQWNHNETYFTQYYNIQNYTLTNSTLNATLTNISLYNLLQSSGQVFNIKVKDANYLPLTDALIKIDRQYINLGKFLTAEIPVTDSSGSTVGHLILNNQLYNIYIIKNGRTIAQFLNQQPYCNPLLTDCIISLNIAGPDTNPTTLVGEGNVIYTPRYIDSTRTYYLDFVSYNGSAVNVMINGSQSGSYVCNGQLTATSGTASCIIPQTYENQTVFIQAFSNGDLLFTDLVEVGYTIRNEVLSKSRYILAGLLVPVFVLMAAFSGSIALILFILGLILCAFIFLIDTQSIVGAGSFIVWFAISAIVLIIKIAKGGAKNG